MRLADMFPHDVAGWITLAIALLSAFLGWLNRKPTTNSQNLNGRSQSPPTGRREG